MAAQKLAQWIDEESGKKYVQIQGQIYEAIHPGRPGALPGPPMGWGDVPEYPPAEGQWQTKGGGRGQRWQRAHRQQQLLVMGSSKGGGKSSGQRPLSDTNAALRTMGGGKDTGKSRGQKQKPRADAAAARNGQGTYKGSSRPSGGASYPSARPWVPCSYPLCPGHNGRASFKFLDAIGQGEHGLCCMGCNTPWAKSLVDAGFDECQLAGGALHGLEPSSANPSLVSSADIQTAMDKSPFADDIAITCLGGAKAAPFAKLGGEATPFRQLPQQALDACPEQLRATLSLHLLRKAVPAEQIAKLEQMASEGQEVAKAYMAAVAIALPFLEAKPLPKTAAPKMAAKDQRSAKVETSASYTALQSALSESQRVEAGKHKLQNALTAAKEAKRKLQEDYKARALKLQEDIKKFEEELSKAEAECQAAREAHARAVARHDAHCAAFPTGADASEPQQARQRGGVELLPHLLNIAKQARIGASEEVLQNVCLCLVKAGAIRDPGSGPASPDSPSGVVASSAPTGGYAAALAAEALAEERSLQEDKPAADPSQLPKAEDVVVEDDDDLDPINQQEAALAAASGPGAMELDQTAKRDAANLLTTPLEAFADLGEQPSAKKLHKQTVRQLTETEVLLELVAMQKPALEAGEVTCSTSADKQSSGGCGGNPAASSSTGQLQG